MEQKFEFPDGSYSISNTKGYFKHIIKNHEAVINNPPIRIYLIQIENGLRLD